MTNERHERIRILLRTRNDPYSNIRAKATPFTVSGPGDGKERKCPVCLGKGVEREATSKRGKAPKCPGCDGRKTIKVDSYIGRVSDEKRTVASEPQVIDSEIARLTGYRMREAGKADPNEAYGWERAVEARNRQGSYRELERALDALRAVAPIAWEFITWVYGSSLEVQLSPKAKRWEAQVIYALSAVMPRRIRLPRHLHAQFAEDRKKNAVQLPISCYTDKANVSSPPTGLGLSQRRPMGNKGGAVPKKRPAEAGL